MLSLMCAHFHNTELCLDSRGHSPHDDASSFYQSVPDFIGKGAVITTCFCTCQATHKCLCLCHCLCSLQLWDVGKQALVRTMDGHRARVGSIAWGAQIMSSGSRDKHILQRDIRVPENYVSKLSGHRSEVCGLKVRRAEQSRVGVLGNEECAFFWK